MSTPPPPAGNSPAAPAAPPDRPRPAPTPLDPPMLPFALGGTGVWALIGLVLLPFRHQLATTGHGSWLWICLAGFLVGLGGIAIMARHDAHRRRRHGG